MKVGEKGVDELKIEAWVDEDIVFAGGLSGFGVVFEGASDSSAEGDDAVMVFSGGLDFFDGFGRDLEIFGVHFVVFEVFGADGKEGAEADVEGEGGGFDAFLA